MKKNYVSEIEIEAVERFLADAQLRLHQLMEVKGVSRSTLAAKLGMSKSRVSAMFGPNANLTLETVARILFALEESGAVLSSPAIDRRMAVLQSARKGAKPVGRRDLKPLFDCLVTRHCGPDTWAQIGNDNRAGERAGYSAAVLSLAKYLEAA